MAEFLFKSSCMKGRHSCSIPLKHLGLPLPKALGLGHFEVEFMSTLNEVTRNGSLYLVDSPALQYVRATSRLINT